MSCAADIHAFAKRTKIKADLICRKVTIDMTREIVRATPVDTGLARSSWFFGPSRNPEVGKVADKSGGPSVNRVVAFAPTIGSTTPVWYMTNNIDYIMALEYGWSKQAPVGMVRITVERWQTIVNRMAAR